MLSYTAIRIPSDVFLQKPFVRSVFEHISEEDLAKAAKTTCYTGMRDAISFIHGNNDVDSIIDVIKLWLSASKFTSTVNKFENTVEIRIQHNLGQKCSLYMGTLITMIFADLNMKPEKSMLKDHSLILTFKIPLSRNIYLLDFCTICIE